MQALKDGTRHLILKGATWIAAGRGLISVIGFVSALLLARLLVPADFGLVAISTSITAIIAAVTELSLAQALIQKNDPDEADYHTVFTLNLLRAIGLAVLIAGSAFAVADIYGDGRLVAIMLVIAGSTLLSGLVNPKMVVFQRSLVFKQDFILTVSQKLAGLLVAIPVALFYRSYWALVAGGVATQLCAVVASYGLIAYRPQLTIARWRGLMSFSIWLTLVSAVKTVNWRIDSLVVGYAKGVGPLGLYSMGDNLAGLPTREALLPLTQTLFPAFSRIRDDKERLRSAYVRSSAALCTLAFPIGFGLAAVSDPFVVLFLGDGWLGSIPVIKVLAVSIALQMAGWPMMPLGAALGDTRSVFIRELWALGVRVPFLVGGLWLGETTDIGWLGGLLLGRLVGGLLGTAIDFGFVRALIGLPIARQLAGMARPFLAAAAMWTAVHLAFPAWNAATPGGLALMFAAAIALGAAVYAGVLTLCWQLQGRPAGPEGEAFEVLAKALNRRGGMPS